MDSATKEKESVEDSLPLDEKERALKIVNQAVAEHYETSQKPTIQTVIEKVRLRCREEKLTPPSEETVRKHIRMIDQR